MDDERRGDGWREPLWPPDATPDLSPERSVTPAAPSVSDAPTERIPVAPANTPAETSVSDAPTEHIPVAHAPSAPLASESPTHRLSAPPAPPTSSLHNTVADAETVRTPVAPPRSRATARLAPRRTPPPLPPPLRPAPSAAPERRWGVALAWARARWRLLTAVAALIVVVVTALDVANAVSLANQSQQAVTRYCVALTQADYTAAYALLTPSLQRQSTLTQFEADGAARDAISGRVMRCSTTLAPQYSALSFLGNPRSLVFNMTLTRASGASGQLFLARDATGWHVTALSASVAGVDLGPLHTEQALCQAFTGRKYDVAYGLLSKTYQREQGGEAAFARAFGANLTITGCAPALQSYTVDSADQRAAFQVTLDVAVSDGGATSRLTLPAKLTLVREAVGWRVDTITPLLRQ